MPLNVRKMIYFDLDNEVTMFKRQRSREDGDKITVEKALKLIEDEVYMDIVSKIRSGEDSDEEDLKRGGLPTVSFHGQFDGARRKENFKNPTGLIIVDIDNVKFDSLESYKSDIMLEMDSCIACFVSPSGNGLKCLYLVDQDIVNVNTYRKIGDLIKPKFDKYGDIDVLSITDCLILSADKDILINEEAIPDTMISANDVHVDIEKKVLQKREDKFELYEDAEEFFIKVIYDKLSESANNNYHFIQMSVFELAKFGFKSPDHDLSFIIEMSEDLFKPSKDNYSRLRESIDKAFFKEQEKWPYDYEMPIEIRESIGGLGGGGLKMTTASSLSQDGENIKADKEEDKDIDFVFDDVDDTVDVILDDVNYDELFDSVVELIAEGDRTGCEISLSNFANVFRWKSGLTVFTGIPSHGKTDFLDQNLVDLSRMNDWHHSVAGFEQSISEHISKLMRKVLGFNMAVKNSDQSEVRAAFDFVVKNIHFVDIRKTGGNLKTILAQFERHIELYGSRNFVIDPFNLISIRSKSDEQGQAKEILKILTEFHLKHNVSVMLVAHPTKMKKDEKTGKYIMPEFYDVKGTSAFYEMAYHGLSIYRDDDNPLTPVTVRILKVKQNSLGVARAEVYFRYERGSGRYVPVDENGNDINGDWNKKNWHKLTNIKK